MLPVSLFFLLLAGSPWLPGSPQIGMSFAPYTRLSYTSLFPAEDRGGRAYASRDATFRSYFCTLHAAGRMPLMHMARSPRHFVALGPEFSAIHSPLSTSPDNSTWHGYMGAKGQIYPSRPETISDTDFWLTRFMSLEGGIYRLRSQGKLLGIGMGATLAKRNHRHSENTEELEDGWLVPDESLSYRLYRNWFIPIRFELQFISFPGGRVGAGRYYRAGIRTTRSYLIWQERWKWRPYESSRLSYHLGAGYGWKVGSNNNVRLEGQCIFGGEWFFQAAMTFGRWW